MSYKLQEKYDDDKEKYTRIWKKALYVTAEHLIWVLLVNVIL